MANNKEIQDKLNDQQAHIYKELHDNNNWTVIREHNKVDEPKLLRNNRGVVDNMVDFILERGKLTSKMLHPATRERVIRRYSLEKTSDSFGNDLCVCNELGLTAFRRNDTPHIEDTADI